MDIPPLGYGVLVAILVAAILIDFTFVHVAAQFLKPANAYVFFAGRLGKLLAVGLWVWLMKQFWLPQYLPYLGASVQPGLLNGAAAAILGTMLLLAGVTLPRPPRARRDGNG